MNTCQQLKTKQTLAQRKSMIVHKVRQTISNLSHLVGIVRAKKNFIRHRLVVDQGARFTRHLACSPLLRGEGRKLLLFIVFAAQYCVLRTLG